MAKASKSPANPNAGAKRRPPSGGKPRPKKPKRPKLSAAEERSLRFNACKDEILARLARGQSLLDISETPGMPPESTVRQWVVDDFEGFAASYAHARDLGLDAVADQIIRISDESNADTYLDEDGNVRTNGEVVQRSKLRVDTRKWYLSKIAPKKYGDRLQVDATVSVEVQNMDDDELQAATIERFAEAFGVKVDRLRAFLDAEGGRPNEGTDHL